MMIKNSKVVTRTARKGLSPTTAYFHLVIW